MERGGGRKKKRKEKEGREVGNASEGEGRTEGGSDGERNEGKKKEMKGDRDRR